MSDISKITLHNGETYSLKDAMAREHLVPENGSVGQVLTKTSNGAEWADTGGGGGGEGQSYVVTTSGNVTINVTDAEGTPVLSVADVPDAHGGIEKRITAIDISDTSATAEDVAQGKVFYSSAGTRTTGTARAGGDELYNLINGSITDSEIDWSKITAPKAGAFLGCSQITSVDNPTIDDFRQNLFRNCANLTKIEVGVTSISPRYASDVMRDNPKLTEATIHFLYSQNPNNVVWISGSYFFSNDPLLTTVIFDVVHAKFGFSNGWFFYDTPLLRNLVIKCDKAVAGLSLGLNTNAWGGIAENPTESTIWVPQALISDYQTATNWSTLYNAGVTFAPIEGSIYE